MKNYNTVPVSFETKQSVQIQKQKKSMLKISHHEFGTILFSKKKMYVY